MALSELYLNLVTCSSNGSMKMYVQYYGVACIPDNGINLAGIYRKYSSLKYGMNKCRKTIYTLFGCRFLLQVCCKCIYL